MQWNIIFIFVLFAGSITVVSANNKTEEGPRRAKKALGIFSVIRFPNSMCQGSDGYNGTCYTTEECSAKGGSSSGTCASSFGVCCTFAMACGSSASENCTYQVITSYSTTTDSDPCTYEVCRSSSDICKLRIDFTAFTLAPPLTANTISFITTAMIINAEIIDVSGPNLGDCKTDTFTVTSIGNVPPPIICGKNAGQHLYVDVTDCVTMNFNIGTGSTSVTRSWNLKTTQIECSNRLADHECLQYHTGTTGAFMSFNFDPTTTATSTITTGGSSATTQHLSNQYYSICFRREEDYCGICFSPLKTGGPAIVGTFGVSASADTGPANNGGNEVICTGVAGVYADFIEIDGLVNGPPTTAPTSSVSTTGAIGVIDIASKTCGGFFASNNAISAADITACTYRVPFKWGVHFDAGEVAITAAAIALNTLEQSFAAAVNTVPNGMIGFSMLYWQTAC